MPETLRPATYRDIIIDEARKARVSPELALAMVDVESGTPGTEAVTGDQSAVSPKGARGFFQIMPETAKELGIDPTDPIQNIRGGLTYFRRMVDKHGGDVRLALAAYNAGPGAVAKAGGVPNFPETTAYVEKILGRLKPGGAAGAPEPSRGRLVAQSPSQVVGVEQTPEEAAGGPPELPTLPGLASIAPERTEYLVGGGERRRRLVAIPPPPGLGPAETVGAYGASALSAMKEAVDIRTRTGRRNISGAVGAAAGGILAAPTVVAAGPAGPALGATIGAGVAGGLEELGEQAYERFVGQRPELAIGEVGQAASEQSLYELAGQIFLLPTQAILRRGMSIPVGREAHAAVRQVSESRVRDLKTVIDQVTKAEKPTGAPAAMQRAVSGVSMTIGKPPLASKAGRAVRRLLSPGGGAHEARRLAGEAVEETAALGPEVSTAGVKQALDEMGERMIPSVRKQAAATEVGYGKAALSREELRAAWEAKLANMGLATTAEHPLPGLLGELQHLPDQISYLDAHKYKKLLDDAIGSGWDSEAKKQVGQITKGVRTKLREAMEGFTPYDEATAKYEAIIPLYTKEAAARFRKVARTDPESLVRLMNPEKPTSVRMIRDLLVRQSAEGGQAALGERAWDMVRSAWFGKRVLSKGIGKLDDTLKNLDPETLSILGSDAKGAEVIQNLQTLASAYKTLIDRLKSSRLASVETKEQLGAHAARAFGQGIFNVWGGISWMHLLLGPRSRELLEWAAYSTPNTRRLVSALTSATPGEALADVFRLAGLSPQTLVGRKAPGEIGQPPPQSRVAAPPPR